MILSEIMREPIPQRASADARSKALRGAPGRPVAHQTKRVEQTNPNSPVALTLTSRQLAAARLTVQGMSSEAVAQRLATIRQTVNRWKRLPAFIAEVRRLHDLLVSQIR